MQNRQFLHLYVHCRANLSAEEKLLKKCLRKRRFETKNATHISYWHWKCNLDINEVNVFVLWLCFNSESWLVYWPLVSKHFWGYQNWTLYLDFGWNSLSYYTSRSFRRFFKTLTTQCLPSAPLICWGINLISNRGMWE